MSDSVDVAIIGGGQAGLAVSWYLKQAGIEHVVLESGRVGEAWRRRRWDSFCLVLPNWSVQLPGARYDGPEPDGFMPLADIVAYLESWAASFNAPIREQSPVSLMEADSGGGFALSLADGRLRARTVVVATGGFQRAHRPAGSDALPNSVNQIYAEEYSHPGALPEGAVLVVGSGQTGCQLAEELHEARRRVFLSCGRNPWVPREIGGRDAFWWALETGLLDTPCDKLPSPAARLLSTPQSTGHGGGHDLHYRTLHAQGVELLGRFLGADGSKIHFADDLAASVDFGDARWGDLRKLIGAYCAARGMTVPELETPAPMRISTRTELDIGRDDIGTVIWTSGYRPEYGWVRFPVFDEMGFPVQTDGQSAVPGLYFIGVHWMRKQKSAGLYGVGEDAELVAQHIAQRRV